MAQWPYLLLGLQAGWGSTPGAFGPFYACDWVVCKGGQSGIIPRTTLSNHSMATLEVDALAHTLTPTSCKILDSIYVSEDVHAKIEKL